MPYIAPEDRSLAMVTTVLTNLSLLPAVYHAASKRHWVHFVIFLSTFVTSLFYHFAEVMQSPIFGMKDGGWHRLDTVCSILCFQTLAIYFADIRHHHEEEGVRWALLMIALWCQERSPWEVEYTIIPIAIAFLFTIASIVYNNQMPLVNKNIRYALLWGIVAVYFFFVGLDDRNDWIRINHGMWHTFAGLAIHYALKSKEHHPEDSYKQDVHKI